jgi:uncharacterized RDD family membrane protein YckC
VIPSRPALPDPRPALLGGYAGFVSRLLAEAIDVTIIAITFVSLTWFTSVTATMLQVRSFLGFSIRLISGADGFIEAIFGPVGGSLITLLYVVGYHVIFWSLTGQTPGKALLGLRVVTQDGRRVSPWRALVRIVAYVISAAPLYLGFLWIFIDDRRQAWHDKLAGTVVIFTWAARPDEVFLADQIDDLTAVQRALEAPNLPPTDLPPAP